VANWLAGNAVVDQHLDCFTDQVRTRYVATVITPVWRQYCSS